VDFRLFLLILKIKIYFVISRVSAMRRANYSITLVCIFHHHRQISSNFFYINEYKTEFILNIWSSLPSSLLLSRMRKIRLLLYRVII